MEKPVMSARLLTLEELCAVLRISKRTWYRHRRRGGLPMPIKVGAGQRWRIDDVERWLKDAKRDADA